MFSASEHMKRLPNEGHRDGMLVNVCLWGMFRIHMMLKLPTIFSKLSIPPAMPVPPGEL